MKSLIISLLVIVSLTSYAQNVIHLDLTYYKSQSNDCFSGTHPLYVVDNKVFPCDSIQFINAKDIEAINVYKGAEAETLYGPAGSRNGTVAITTKHYAALLKRNKEAEETEKP